MDQGIYNSMKMEEYISDPCPEPSLSTGIVDALLHKSPAHAYHEHPRLGGAKSESSRADLGSAAHGLLLGGEKSIEVVDAADWRTKEARQIRDEARKAGKIPILAEDEQKLREMVKISKPILDGFGVGMTEQTLIWQDAISGVWCRSRPDWMNTDSSHIVDYKTATNADPSTWIKSVLFSGGYDIQAALVMRGIDAILKKEDRTFIFLVQEIEPPFCCSKIALGPEALDLANREINIAIKLWSRCLSTKEWPGYISEIHWAEVPSYVQWDFEGRAYGVER
jgi:hypothetical protein